ncbi:hypothetical protein RhiirC2_736902 [Rhizophagus irregularis]|uniref:Uncharacterized protein n=1 Tax=Rhizophagus irregularis TaxID=588596 RepID=A0A2N1NN64_9GLOM|nr:hypothetical protein RhiirC2_736902 [Rhizophagus irregularis]
MTEMQTLIATLRSSHLLQTRQQPNRKAKRTKMPYEKTPLRDVKKRFIDTPVESAMEDSDALPRSDEYYTESGEVSDTGTIENTYELTDKPEVESSTIKSSFFGWT